MPVQDIFKNIDIVKLYNLAPSVWDLALFTAFFYHVFKRGIAGAFSFQGGIKAIGKSLMSGRAPGAEHRETLRGISFVLALGSSLILVVQAKVSLNYLFTSGIFPVSLGLRIWTPHRPGQEEEDPCLTPIGCDRKF